MSKKKLPDTSIAAYKEAEPLIEPHHINIVRALRRLKSGIYEEIAAASGMEKNQVGRRLKELEEMEIVFKPGRKKMTSKGRYAYEYELTNKGISISVGVEPMPESSTTEDIKKRKEKYQPEANPLFKF